MRQWGGYSNYGDDTYEHLLLATVVCLLQESGIEIMEIEFSLNRKLVVRVKDFKREHRFWFLEGRRIPAYA